MPPRETHVGRCVWACVFILRKPTTRSTIKNTAEAAAAEKEEECRSRTKRGRCGDDEKRRTTSNDGKGSRRIGPARHHFGHHWPRGVRVTLYRGVPSVAVQTPAATDDDYDGLPAHASLLSRVRTPARQHRLLRLATARTDFPHGIVSSS